VNKTLLAHWRANFFTGLAVVLPAVISIAVLIWLFGTVANVTDTLLFFLPRKLTHANQGDGPMYRYWSGAAIALAILLISMLGLLTRYYIGKRLIALMDIVMLKVPLLNKVYSTIKQVNEAFSSGKKSSFKTVVMIQFPGPGLYSLGFLTSEQQDEVQAKTGKDVVCVFVPTTPNPTSGFLVLVPVENVTRLDMSVAEGIKYIISIGSLSPEHARSNPGLSGPANPAVGRLPS
jgi:uncharacterized membrane protein